MQIDEVRRAQMARNQLDMQRLDSMWHMAQMRLLSQVTPPPISAATEARAVVLPATASWHLAAAATSVPTSATCPPASA